MGMTRKHFKAIAEAISDNSFIATSTYGNEMFVVDTHSLINVLARSFELDNPDFNYRKFREAATTRERMAEKQKEPAGKEQSWSEQYYEGLTDIQHQANDEWFKKSLSLLNDTGVLGVSNILKFFNKQGEEVNDNHAN